jgi:hypothetical protein
VPLHLRINECRFRITPIRLWLKTALKECDSAEIGGLGGGAPAGGWTIPRRTRALPALASPCSRRFAPLSSGEPVRPA